MKKRQYILYFILAFIFVLVISMKKIDNGYYLFGNDIIFLMLFLYSIRLLLSYKLEKKNLLFIIPTFLIILTYLYYNNFIFFSIKPSIILMSYLVLIGIFVLSWLLFIIVKKLIVIKENIKKVGLKKSLKLLTIFNNPKRTTILILFMSIIFSLFEIVGKIQLLQSGILSILSFKNLLLFIFYFICFFTTLSWIFNIDLKDKLYLKFKNKKTLFILSFTLFFIFFLYYYLKYFPGMFSNDSIYQLAQAIGDAPATAHHPVILTILINLFSRISENIRLDMIIYCLFQITGLALSLSYMFYYLIKKNINVYLLLFLFIYLLTSPIVSMYSFTVWKDIPFSISMIFLVILLIEIITNGKAFFSNKLNIVFFIIVSFLVITFRHNGMYAWLLTMPFIILFSQRYKLMIINCGIVLILYAIFTGPIYNYLNIRPGSHAEALSIPIQQIARSFRDHKELITQEELEIANKYLDAENIGVLYNPVLSDPVKATFSNKYYEENKTEFYQLWYSLLKKYPITFIDSFLSNNYGYWYPSTVYWTVYTHFPRNYELYRPEYNIDTSPVIKNNFTDETLMYKIREIPVLSMLYSVAFPFWILFACICYSFIKRNYKIIAIDILFVALWLTLIASPVFAEYRYMFSLILCIPLIISLNFHYKSFVKEGDEKA